MYSKWHELIRQYTISCFKEIDADKQFKFEDDLKEFFLELIGEDYATTSYGGNKDDSFVKVANNVKSELRQKVEAL